MDNPWLLFLFLSVFHVIGAAVLAKALRELWQDLGAVQIDALTELELRDLCPGGQLPL